jgi:putative membrane-bound dehydrogenase-like protein
MRLNSILLLIVSCLPSVAGTVLAREAQFASIFDGRTLNGWTGDLQYWRIEDGAITGEIPANITLRTNQFLFYENDVHDFEIELEYRIAGDATANSGIQFRSQAGEHGGAAGYQADLDHGDTWLGRIYDEHGRALLVERGTRVSIAPDGRRWTDKFAEAAEFAALPKRDGWNKYQIRATGSHAEVWINGKLCAVLDDHELGAAEYSGKLALQLHSGPGPVKVQFRNIRLKHLGRTEFPKYPAAAAKHQDRQTQSPVLWHLRPNPAAPSRVENADAQKVIGGMMLTEGFQAELIAAEPDVHQPIALAIDERGRLWVAEAFSYPTKQPAGKGLDRILILEDRDGDGAFETKKTFTEGLNLVSGIEVGFGGVWIGAAPELLFIPDRDGDDKSDGPPQVLLDGFGYQDTHETLNSFTWGPDGWLYGNQGVFNTAMIGKPGASDSERTELRAGVWRYHPVRHEFEIFAHGGSNQWGLDFNDVGHLFMTHCRSYWGGGGTSYVIRNGHFWNQTNADYAPFINNSAPEEIPHLMNFLPASAKYDSGEGGAGKPGTTAVYGGHSHVGTMIYLGDNWPAIYRNRLFTHNLHGHQVNQQLNVREGSAYETLHAGFDLMYAPDPAYVPVDLQYGPDGAAYVIDWTDREHCHNPRGEVWDRSNGRIYRVTWARTFRPIEVELAARSDAELVELQSHKNRWFGRTARRLLQERAANRALDTIAVGRARALLETQDDEPLALAGLWTLHVTGNLMEDDYQKAISHPSDFVRAWAAQLATESRHRLQVSAGVFQELAENDPSPTVRLALASVLPMLAPDTRWQVGAALAEHGEDADDRFLPKMIWYGIADLTATNVPRAMALAESTPLEVLADSTYWYLARHPQGRDALTQAIATSLDDSRAERLLVILHHGVQSESKLAMPERWSEVRRRFARSENADALSKIDELSAQFGDQETLGKFRAILSDTNARLRDRRHALRMLKRVGDRQAAPIYVQLLDEESLREDAIELVSMTSGSSAAVKLLEVFPDLSESERTAALNTLTSSADFARALLHAIENGALDKKHLSALQIRRLANIGNEELNRRVEKVWGKITPSSADTKAAIEQLKKTYSAAPLWAFDHRRGRQVYERTCAVCHPLDGSTTPLGPSLVGSWRNGLDYFVENIVDPNAVVGESFRTTVIVTQSGTVVTGMLDSETDSAVVLRTAEERIVVPKDEIDDRRLESQSIMPTAILDTLTEVERIELLKFLTTEPN